MTTTLLQIPDLPAGIDLTIDILNLSTLAVLEAGIEMTETDEVYEGDCVEEIAGQFLFLLKAGGTFFESRIRTIADTAGPFVIITDLEHISASARGTRVVTLTIDDGTDPVVGATVRVSAPGFVATEVSDGSGIVRFVLDDGDFVLVVEKIGYAALADTLTVSGTTSATFSLTENEVTVSDSPLLSTGTLTLYDEDNELEFGQPVSLQWISGPGDDGYGMDKKIRTELSVAYTAVVTFTRLRRGALYRIWRGPATPTDGGFVSAYNEVSEFTVPNTGSFLLPQIGGTDEEEEA